MSQIRALPTEGSCWCRLCPHWVPVSDLLLLAVETGPSQWTSLSLSSYRPGNRNNCPFCAMFMGSFLKTPEDMEIMKFFTHVRGLWKMDGFPPGREVGFLSPFQKPFLPEPSSSRWQWFWKRTQEVTTQGWICLLTLRWLPFLSSPRFLLFTSLGI